MVKVVWGVLYHIDLWEVRHAGVFINLQTLLFKVQIQDKLFEPKIANIKVIDDSATLQYHDI